MKHLMIDAETLALDHDASMASLGWCPFELGDNPSVGTQGGVVINVMSMLIAGGTINKDTISWWRGQDEAAIEAVTHGGVPIVDVLNDFRKLWNQGEYVYVWSHGASFDIPLVEQTYRRVLGEDAPWKYSKVRDTRTLFDLAEQKGWERPQRETAHVASLDAKDQADDVIGAYKWIMRNV